MRNLVLCGVLVLGLATRAIAIGPACDESTTGNTGDVCISGTEELSTQSYKLSFIDPLAGATCMDADKGSGSMWVAEDFVANPLIGKVVAICTDNADMNPEPAGSLLLIPRGTLYGSARRAAAIETLGLTSYECDTEDDAGRVEINNGSDPPYLKWCHWDGSVAADKYAAVAGSNGVPVSIGTTAEFDSTCDATGIFTNGDTVITLADYDNLSHQTQITATISFTAVAAATFTIQAKLEGSQVGTDVTCSAAIGFKASCTISILDTTSNPNRTFTITASQSAGSLNTVDTCNVTRMTVHD